jgi:hypothetical protein
VGPTTGLDGCGRTGPAGIRSLDRSACSVSVYRLSYPGPHNNNNNNNNNKGNTENIVGTAHMLRKILI